MHKFKLWLVIFVILLLCVCDAGICKQNKPPWCRSSERKDGIEFIIIPIVPMYEEKTVRFFDELQIRNIDDPEKGFAGNGDIEVDKNGNTFVLNPKENLIRIFDANVGYSRSFGSHGHGPGEI